MTGTVDERLAAALCASRPPEVPDGLPLHVDDECRALAHRVIAALADSGVVLVEREAHEAIRDALEDMVNQFAYWSDADPPGQIMGGLSALEGAFAALGYDEPHPADHLRCDEP